MNKFVIEGYPVERLPDDIQKRISDAKEVRVIVEVPDRPEDQRRVSLEEIFAARRPPFLEADEIMEEIYQGRYEDR